MNTHHSPPNPRPVILGRVVPCFSPLLGMISNNGLLDSSFFIRSPRGVQNIPRDLTTSPDPQGSALPRHGHRILLKTAQEKGATAVAGEEVEVWPCRRSVGGFFPGKMYPKPAVLKDFSANVKFNWTDRFHEKIRGNRWVFILNCAGISSWIFQNFRTVAHCGLQKLGCRGPTVLDHSVHKSGLAISDGSMGMGQFCLFSTQGRLLVTKKSNIQVDFKLLGSQNHGQPCNTCQFHKTRRLSKGCEPERIAGQH